MICSAPLRLCVRRIEKGLKKNGDTDPLNQYVWHPYFIDALAIRWYDANTSGSPSDYYYCHDANFNVTTIVNSGGTVQNRYAYTPYGEVITLNKSFASASEATGNTHFYTGRERDSETGLQLNRNRFYAAFGEMAAAGPDSLSRRT